LQKDVNAVSKAVDEGFQKVCYQVEVSLSFAEKGLPKNHRPPPGYRFKVKVGVRDTGHYSDNCCSDSINCYTAWAKNVFLPPANEVAGSSYVLPVVLVVNLPCHVAGYCDLGCQIFWCPELSAISGNTERLPRQLQLRFHDNYNSDCNCDYYNNYICLMTMTTITMSLQQ